MPISAPALGSYAVGDDVSVALADPLVPTGYAAIGQLTRIDIDAAAGQGHLDGLTDHAQPAPEPVAAGPAGHC